MVRISNLKQAQQEALRRVATINDRVVEIFWDIGMDAIKRARIEADYRNWTNNLRSSYGVAVSVDGEIKKEDYRLVGDGKDGDGRDGYETAKEMVARLAKQFPDSVAVIIVCGERYAHWVENKGRNVLTSFARKASDDLVKQLKNMTKNG